MCRDGRLQTGQGLLSVRGRGFLIVLGTPNTLAIIVFAATKTGCGILAIIVTADPA